MVVDGVVDDREGGSTEEHMMKERTGSLAFKVLWSLERYRTGLAVVICARVTGPKIVPLRFFEEPPL